MQRLPTAYVTETRHLTVPRGYAGKRHAAGNPRLHFNFSSVLWNGELGLKAVFISVQSTGNKGLRRLLRIPYRQFTNFCGQFSHYSQDQ